MRKTIHSDGQKALLRLLREARKARGVSQVELAARLGESQSFVSKCERGERRLDAVEVWHFCRAMGAPFRSLMARLDNEMGKIEKRGRE